MELCLEIKKKRICVHIWCVDMCDFNKIVDLPIQCNITVVQYLQNVEIHLKRMHLKLPEDSDRLS